MEGVLKDTLPFKKKVMEDLLNELHLLREIELLGKLTERQSKRYLEIVEMCQRNNINIPFGIEL